MISNGMTFMFMPFWLFSRAQDEQDDVQEWLRYAGLDLMRTPGFDFDGKVITTRYYVQGEDGRPQVNEQGDIIFEDQVREFHPKGSVPEAIQEGIRNAEGPR